MARPGEAVGSERQQSVQAQERPAPRQGREQTGALLEQLPGLTAPAAAGLLAEAPADVVLAALRRYAREAGEPAAPLLTELAQREAPGAVQAAAVEALGDLRTPAAADLAARWAEPAIPSGGQADHAGDAAPASAAVSREVRKAARRALLRLAQQGIHPSPRPEVELAPEAPARPERVRRAQMSAVDGEGTRLLYLLIDLPLSGAQMAMAIVSEAEGLLRFEAVESTGRQFERYVTQERPNQDFPLVEVPPTYARWLIGEAARVSQVARKALPPVYSAFREALTPPEMAPESPVYSELDDGTIASIRYRPDLVEESGELLERPEFAFWRPPPDRVAPLAAEWESAERGPLALPPSIAAQRQSAVFDRVVDVVLGPGGVGGFRRRLEDNALVLHRAGATTEARRALAAAARLDPDDPATARTHPFVRALTQQALDLALESRGDEGGEGAALDDVATGGVTDSGASGQGPVTRPSGLILPR